MIIEITFGVPSFISKANIQVWDNGNCIDDQTVYGFDHAFEALSLLSDDVINKCEKLIVNDEKTTFWELENNYTNWLDED